MSKIEQTEGKLKRSIKNNNKKSGLKEVKKIYKYLEHNNQVSDDVIIRLLRLCCNYYDNFDLVEDNIKTLTYLANFYLEFNAMQAAYRAIEEASDLARENNKLKEYIELNKLLLRACFHGEDLNGALECYEIIKELSPNTAIDDGVLLNIGVVYLQQNRIDEAIEIFESLIHYYDESIKFNCKVNLAICYRKKGFSNKSVFILENLDKSKIVDEDYLIEYELVFAKSLVHSEYYEKAILRMLNAVNLIEHKMTSVIKLYYRRGIRERYVSRLENIILSIPPEEISNNILYIVAFTRSNQTSDWMNLLQWCDTVYKNKDVSSIDSLELEKSVQYVADNGAPFLYGMLEKYDDHHDHHSWRWDNLTSIINDVSSKHKIPLPLTPECTKKIYNSLLEYSKSSSLIVSFLSISGKLMLINDGKYEFVTLDESIFLNHIEMIQKYKRNELGSNTFARGVEKTQNYIFDLISNFIVDSDECDKNALVYFPDKYDYFPISSCFFKNESLRNKMIQGEYTIKSVPVMFLGNESQRSCSASKVLGICDDYTLKLSKREIQNFVENLNISEIQLIEQDDNVKFEKEILDSDILHITTHGTPLDFYCDPNHASLGDSHVINTHSIQTKLYKLNYKLVLLNSCHSSSSLNRRQINLTAPNSKLNQIRSYDTFTLPSIFLINRTASCIASSWKTFDKFSYVLSHRISMNMVRFDDYEKSFSASLAELVSVTGSSLCCILDDKVEEQKIMLDSNISTIQMLKHPYAYSTYQFFSLL